MEASPWVRVQATTCVAAPSAAMAQPAPRTLPWSGGGARRCPPSPQALRLGTPFRATPELTTVPPPPPPSPQPRPRPYASLHAKLPRREPHYFQTLVSLRSTELYFPSHPGTHSWPTSPVIVVFDTFRRCALPFESGVLHSLPVMPNPVGDAACEQ